jgi:hypothetical protein
MPDFGPDGMSPHEIVSRQQQARIQEVERERDAYREALEEVASCGHWSDCPAGASERYRCRCAYSLVKDVLERHDRAEQRP